MTWHLPDIPASVRRVTAGGWVYERDPRDPKRWWPVVHGHHLPASTSLGALLDLAGDEGLQDVTEAAAARVARPQADGGE